MAETMFDGFDHTQYQGEIEQRWGKDAYAASDAWWRSMSADEKKAFQKRHIDIAADYAAVRERGGADAGGDDVQAIAARHLASHTDRNL